MRLEGRRVFGKVEQESTLAALVPLGSLFLVVLAWARYPLREHVGFNLDESVIFTGIAVAFMQLSIGRWLFAFALGLALWVYGLLAFGDFALVIESGSRSGAGYWVRHGFSPNGAIISCSLGLGISLVSRRFRRRFQTLLGLVLAMLAVSLAAVALWGHLNGIQAAYTWGRFEALSWSGSFLFLHAATLLVAICRWHSDPDSRPTERHMTVALGLSFSVGATLLVAAMLGDIDSRRSIILSSEMTTSRRAVEVQQDALIKSLKRVGSSVSGRGRGAFDGLASSVVQEFPCLRAIAISSGDGQPLVLYPKGVDLDIGAADALAAEIRIDKLEIASKIVQRGDVWRIAAALPVEDGGSVILALIDLKDFFAGVLSNVPDQTSVRVLYVGDEVLSRNTFGKSESAEVHDLAFTLLGWPGWRFSLASGPQFDEVHALSGVFRLPLMALITAGALAWAWSLSERARAGQRLINEIRSSAQDIGTEHLRWATALESTREIVLLCDTNEKVQYYNGAARAALKFLDDGPAQFLVDIFSPLTLEQLRGEGFEVSKVKGIWNVVGALNTRGDEELPVSLRVVPNFTTEQALAGYSLFIGTPHTSIGDSSLKTMTTASVWHVLESFPRAVWVAGSDGTIEFGNRKLLNILGVTLEQFRRGWPIEFCHRDDVEGFVAVGARLGHHKRRVVCAGGSLTWFEESIAPIKDEEGTAVGFIGGLIECGKERRLGEQARFSTLALSIVMNAQNSVLWVHDLTRNKITFLSRGFSRMWGMSDEELKLHPTSWKGLTQPAVDLPALIPEQGVRLEYSIRRDDGKTIPVLHQVWSSNWSDGVDNETHLYHIVDRVESQDGVEVSSGSAGTVREMRGELEHIYSFLAKSVYESARQIGSLGHSLSDEDSTTGRVEFAEDAGRLKIEAQKLLSWMRDFTDVTKVIRFKDFSAESSIIEALEKSVSARGSIPKNISFSGDLGVKLPVARELLDGALRAIGLFVADRGKQNISLDVRVVVRKGSSEAVLEFGLGELPISREELTGAFLPASQVKKEGGVTPSLAVVSAVARKYNGRAWLVSATSGVVILHVLLRPDRPK
jgi:PAS domain-containing protein